MNYDPAMVSSFPIRIAAALLVDNRGRTLLVRKRGTRLFMQPGGKIEPDERAATALARELEEELGLAQNPAEFRYLARFAAPAANEPGIAVEAELFLLLRSARWFRGPRSTRLPGLSAAWSMVSRLHP